MVKMWDEREENVWKDMSRESDKLSGVKGCGDARCLTPTGCASVGIFNFDITPDALASSRRG